MWNFLRNSMVGAAVACLALPGRVSADPGFWSWALTPVMGWNSYDCWGTSIDEGQTLANAQYMKDHLLSHGWNYVIIDARWYDSVSPADDRDFNRQRAGAKLIADDYGRLLPAANRFPSAADGHGFRPLSDKIHAMGLKFGVHVMRGIPKQSVKAATPIEGSGFTAAEAGDPKSLCGWCPDMFGVRNNEAGQAWYDSIFRLYASWGIDFVKVDDLSNPYHGDEIAMIRRAIDKCGRSIVFSTSPGPTDPIHAQDISRHANQWRVSNDFWDRWGDLNHQFDLFDHWKGVAGPGHFPDGDMIPFGHIGIKCTIAGPDRQSRFKHEEEQTLMSLWVLESSPLMVGANLPELDDATLALLTNDDVLAIDQDPLGHAAARVSQKDGTEVWVKELKSGAKAVGLFNRGPKEATVTLDWKRAGLSGSQKLRDLWQHQDLGNYDGSFSAPIAAHGSVLLLVSP